MFFNGKNYVSVKRNIIFPIEKHVRLIHLLAAHHIEALGFDEPE